VSGTERLAAKLQVAFAGFDLAIDLDLPARGATAFFGASGSGKTTCLRCIAGLEPGASGRVALDGEVWFDSDAGISVPVHRRPIGYVFQDARLFEHLSVRRNLEFGYARVPAAQRKIEFDDVVPRLGIGALLARRPRRLSGGEKQRVAIARALLTSPRLLLLDEPLAAVDEARKSDFFPYLESLRDDFGVPIIYVSHLMPEVARLADHLVVLERGRVVAAGPIDEVSARLDLALAESEEGGVVLQAQVAEHDLAFLLTRISIPGAHLWVGRIDGAVGTRLRIQIAARDVSVALNRTDGTSILNVLPATISARRDDDRGRTLVRLDAGGSMLLARVTRRSAVQLDLVPGRAVYAQIKGVAVHL
jgi:molybdate transport system ATP-binding protein